MTALLVIVAGLTLVGVGWRWSMQSVDGAARVALVAVLGVTAAAFNVVVPIPSVEAYTTVVLCAAATLGLRTGAAAGIVAVIASSVTGGVGIWTLWQLLAVLVVAVLGACLPRVASDRDWFARSTLGLLAAASIGATLAWDVITTAGSALALGLPILPLLLVGAMFTVTHVACTVALTMLGGPPLLHALERARPRLAGGTVVPAS